MRLRLSRIVVSRIYVPRVGYAVVSAFRVARSIVAVWSARVRL